MTVKPPQCRLSLLWGLVLLMRTETPTAEVAVSNNVAVAPTQHVRMPTLSTPGKDREYVEERTISSLAVDQAVRNELRPFAGKLISKDVIDSFHKKNFLVDAMPNFDNMFDANAINELTSLSDHDLDLLVIWFGVKSPKDQEVVLDLLVAQLKENSVSRHTFLQFLEAGKARANDKFRMFAAAVEQKWLMSISTNELYDALELPFIWNDEEFVRRVGHLIWNKFQILGKKEFDSFMLTKMRERSEDDIMWARLISKLENDKTVSIPLSGVFDNLLQTKSVAAGYCKPTDAVRILTSPKLVKVYNDVERTRKEVGALVVEELREYSTDELMWAKLIFVLQYDISMPTIPSSVFDHLLQPYETIIFGKDQCTPSQAIKYLTGPKLSRYDDRLFTGKDFNAELLAELLKKSHDELMWAKVLYMLKNNKVMSAPFSDVVKSILNSWTEWPYNAATIAEQSSFSMSTEILMNPNFLDLYLYAHFSCDNPEVFLLEKLRERSTDDIVWAQALNALLEDQSVLTPLSSVFDALLHSWIEKPYNAAIIAGNQPALIGAYKFLLEYAVSFQDRLTLLTSHEAKTLVYVLLNWSNDESMWAKFLYKLQQDPAFSVVASKTFDALLQLDDAAEPYSLSIMVKYLTSSSFFENYKYVQSRGNADAVLLAHLLTTQSPNQVMWAKVFYILKDGESESTSFFSSSLKTLLAYWTYDVAGVANSPNPLIESEVYLKGQSFANLIAYARFSSENPNAFVLEKLRERSTNDLRWARLLNKLRKEDMKLRYEVHQLRDKDDALSGVLSALLHSWIGKPYNAAAALENEDILIVAYEYLTNQELATWYEQTILLGEENADEAILNQLLQISNDDVMWAKFLDKLKEDSVVDIPLSGVFQTLLQSWIV